MEKERNGFDLKHTTSSVNYGNGMGMYGSQWNLVTSVY